MGARPQIFVIARINQRYRCLAALHHHWLSGEAVTARCLALLKIFQAEANRYAIQQELGAAKSYPAKAWDSGEKTFCHLPVECGQDVAPFPFIATCLVIGASFDPGEGYQTRVHPLSRDISLEHVDNDYGITVIDISDPKQLRYCFASLVDRYYENDGHWPDEVEDPSDGEVIPAMTPLRFSTYLWVYRCSMHPSLRDQVGYAEESEGFRLLDEDALRAVWPDVPHIESEEQNDSVRTTRSPSLHSLKDTAIDEFLTDALRQPQVQTEALLEALQVPGVRLALKEKFYAMAAVETFEMSPTILDLLIDVLRDEDYVDLGPFRAFSSSDICFAISKLQEQGNMTSLSLSNNLNVQESDLLITLRRKSSLRIIYLLGETHVSFSGIKRLAEDPQTSLQKVYHTAQFRQSFARDLRLHESKDTRYVLDLAGPPDTDASITLAGVIYVEIAGQSTENIKSDNGM